MAVFSLPYDTDGQIKVCIALKNHTFCSYSEKDEINRIEQNLNSRANLNESEKQFLEKLLSQYGHSIDI